MEKNFETFFGLLYSLEAFPNLIIPILGSLLNIKYGLRFMYVIYGSTIFLGQLFVCIGMEYKSFILMLIGRGIYGLGYQTVVICKNQILINWFFKTEVALPISISLCITDFSKFMSFYISPRVVEYVRNF